MIDVEAVRSRLEGFASALSLHWPMVGGAVVLVDHERSLISFGFGHADRERRVAARPDHLFQVGSISKTFLSVAIQGLVDEGVMGLDGSIGALLPWADLGGSGGGDVTVRELLSHTAGVPLGADGVPDGLSQLWALRDGPGVGAARGRFHYSNLGFMLLGEAVRSRLGVAPASLLRERLLTPLGMESTRAEIRQRDRDRMAIGYWPARDDSPWVPGEDTIPAPWFEADTPDGSVISTADDMGRFARLLLGDGTVDGVRVLDEAALLRMATPTAPSGEDPLVLRDGFPVTDSRYGLGVNVEQIGGSTCLTHGGGMVGFQSFLLADRGAGVGVAVLTNADGCYPVAQVIARAAHHLLREGGGASLPPPEDAVVTDDSVAPQGDFTSDDEGAPSISVAIRPDGRFILSAGGVEGHLARTWTGRYVTDHPDLRRFRWDAVADTGAGAPGWFNGPHVYASDGGPGSSSDAPTPAARALIGRYRSYSPWFPTFRIFWRLGSLHLAAPGGVEAPTDDLALVEVPGGWRIGAEPWMPERLVAGPIIDGMVVDVRRDGVPYSRTRG